MNAPAVSEKKPQPAPAAPQVPQIHRSALKREEHHNTRWFIRCPQGLTAEHLKDPDIWKLAGGSSGLPLRKLDELKIIAFDESWVAYAIVETAKRGRMTIKVHKLVTLEPDNYGLFQTEEYAVRWVGDGYAVFRKNDDTRMTDPVQSEEMAVRDLNNQYTRKVG